MVIWSPRFASLSCAKAFSQNVNEAVSRAMSRSLGQVALTESAVAVSSAACSAFVSPKLLQKK